MDFKGPHERMLIKIENAIVAKILSNTPPPNAPATIRKKKSSKTLIDTGEMLGHVTHRQSEAGDILVGEVGIFDDEVAKRASYNEHGTDRIPARPTLRPAVDETLSQAQDEMAEEIFKSIEQDLGW